MSRKDKLDTKEFAKRVKERFGERIEVLGEYKNNKTKIKLLNKLTGRIHEVRPDNLFRIKEPFKTENRKLRETPLTENTINKIIKTKRRNSLKTIDEIKKLVDHKNYILLEEKTSYINNKKKSITLKCKKCGLEFQISFVNLKQGRGCRICNKELRQESKNMTCIKEFLNKNNIEFKTEYKLEGCKNERVLPFDIGIENEERILLIEYDGEFHDYGYNNNKEALKRTIRNDSIKDQFCRKNNIPLLRLRYNNFSDYEEKLKEFLIKNGIKFRD